jgi:hypothetical protein
VVGGLGLEFELEGEMSSGLEFGFDGRTESLGVGSGIQSPSLSLALALDGDILDIVRVGVRVGRVDGGRDEGEVAFSRDVDLK